MIEVRRGDELGERYRPEIAKVLVRGFAEDFSSFSTDSERLAAAFAPLLVLENWRLALVKGAPAAVAFVTEGTQEAFAPRWEPMRRELGLLRGTITHLVVRSQFVGAREGAGLPGLGEIGFVATDPAHRGRGAAKALMQAILEEDFEDFLVLEVKDTNEAALGLYRSVGFEEFRRRPARLAKRAGFHHYVDLRRVPQA
ncbi:MAG: GNAT family N-acetyltransferase [Brachybacterium sp.]|uniref:GNAT family N-acetyltransferase n=1 Tax=Brachybacterium sp. TaxID=1891286 RepID=UPI0026482295|nr:GNAT family N-acetyltransferase [Brachybacterium sp.]MDN5685203.1 GNAT family N-acetyltransferase [Brachybacterium sp.]